MKTYKIDFMINGNWDNGDPNFIEAENPKAAVYELMAGLEDQITEGATYSQNIGTAEYDDFDVIVDNDNYTIQLVADGTVQEEYYNFVVYEYDEDDGDYTTEVARF